MSFIAIINWNAALEDILKFIFLELKISTFILIFYLRRLAFFLFSI